MAKRSRILTFGGAAALVVAGVACAVAVGGGVGQILALVLVGIGLVAAVSLVFYEIGLSEDHERAREERAREERTRAARAGPGRGARTEVSGRRLRPVARLSRLRGQQRRLR